MPDHESDELTGFERAVVWCGLAGTVIIFAGLVIAHLLPPPPPSRSAAEVAAFYQQHTGSFRLGTILAGSGTAMLTPWIAVVARQLHRIPGHGRSMSYSFLGIGVIAMFQVVLPLAIGQVAAFRPDRPAAETQDLNDLFLLLLISPAYLFVVMLGGTGLAILFDRGERPVFARWIGYVGLWAAIGSFPGILTICFKHGPWAWNGLFGWWLPVFVFGVWVISMSIGVLAPSSRKGEGGPATASLSS